MILIPTSMMMLTTFMMKIKKEGSAINARNNE